MVSRLMRAHWKEGANIGDPATLARLAGEVGMDPTAVARLLATDADADDNAASPAATAQGTGCATPTPSDIASGMGESICAASYSRAMDLSRITAQPAVRMTSTFRPLRL